ncbi:MAG: hypothetical protein LPK45_08265 [Bacteroidota bacterium]|nr:hypothetical protein [Bacteroidota bacterium]MDX5431062.1 hypothetical protein [Bacteroidota bacterium]MDX5469816.1 hypothetical protein [Bacteroidota bacterium]
MPETRLIPTIQKPDNTIQQTSEKANSTRYTFDLLMVVYILWFGLDESTT